MRRLARLLLAARVGIACSATEPDGACDAAPPTEVLPTGWYEVAIRVSIDGHDRLFFAREDTISAAAAGFCDAHAAGQCRAVANCSRARRSWRVAGLCQESATPVSQARPRALLLRTHVAERALARACDPTTPRRLAFHPGG